MSGARESPFSRRTLLLLVGVGLGSVLFGFALAILGGGAPNSASDSTSFSQSALGHSTFVRYLDGLRIPTVVSRYESGSKAREALLLMVEPQIHVETEAEAEEMMNQAQRVLLVLPKWFGEENPKRPGYIERASLLAESEVLNALHLVDAEGEVRRPEESLTVSTALETQILPSLVRPQIVWSERIEPIVAVGDGILFGKVVGRDVWVLSDPDLLSNHGLDNGKNAYLVAQILDEIRGERTVVIDETLHGFLRKPSLWRALFEMPLVLVTLQILLCVVLLIWAGTDRFGKPIPLSPPFEAGTRYLVSNTARLLRIGGHSRHALERYRELTLRRVRRQMHPPAHLDDAGFFQWLARVEEHRGMKRRIRDVSARIDELCAFASPSSKDLLAAAVELHHWKSEISHGHTNS